jgi:tetraspanin-5
MDYSNDEFDSPSEAPPVSVRKLHLIDRSEVSIILKYCIFGFNILVWLLGFALIAVGTWAAYQKHSKTIGAVFFDPVLFFIILGVVFFIVGFIGCISALREWNILLIIYAVIVGVALLVTTAGAVVLFAFRSWVKNALRSPLEKTIAQYREDLNLEDLIDWVQSDWLRCCGVDNYRDWERNMYFNCSSKAIEACGVPFSCCQPDPTLAFTNLQCGYGVLLQDDLDIMSGTEIYTKGCLEQGDKWFQQYMVPIAGVIVSLAVIFILGICCACNLAADIKRQKRKWLRLP